MVNKKEFWLGILVIVLVFGTTVTGCDIEIPKEDDGDKIPLTVLVTGIPSTGHIGQAKIIAGFGGSWDGIWLGSSNTPVQQNGSVTVTLDMGVFLKTNEISGEPPPIVIELVLLDSPTSGKSYRSKNTFSYNQRKITVDYEEFDYRTSSTWE